MTAIGVRRCMRHQVRPVHGSAALAAHHTIERYRYVARSQATPVVLGTAGRVGATTVPTRAFATAFGGVHAIAIGALLAAQDAVGAPRRQGEQGWI